jgi:phosphomannomutase
MKANFKNAEECWKIIRHELRPELLATIEEFAHDNKEPAQVEFGTSGWRGIIGADFTFHNVRIVTQAIINTLKTQDPVIRQALGTPDFSIIQAKGDVVGHDNRFLGPQFAQEIMDMLDAEGIKVFYCGETTTPQISASIDVLGAACSINITPSHNPSPYAGLKFNPMDGGPAGSEITDFIQAEANRMMQRPAPAIAREKTHTQPVKANPLDTYLTFLRRRGTLDLDKIQDFVHRSDCLIVIDHVHGATRGVPEILLHASDILNKKLVLLRTNSDYLFGGVAPEPSAKNMEAVDAMLKQSRAKFKIGAIMDPDGDRIRFADHTMQIPMNYFGAMALHFLHAYKGIKGVVVKSVGTSNFANAIAEKKGIPVHETMVGFKNFRPFMLPNSPERAIVAFEESDGISGFNHTLEKDALFGLLLAIEMVATTGKNLGEYFQDLTREFGCFYPDRSGIEVDRRLVGAPLKEKITAIQKEYPEGSAIRIGDRSLKVKKLITTDGTKIVLEDDSWLMIRPSGTEPKVRFYVEARSPEDIKAIFKTAQLLTESAIAAD